MLRALDKKIVMLAIFSSKFTFPIGKMPGSTLKRESVWIHKEGVVWVEVSTCDGKTMSKLENPKQCFSARKTERVG